MNQSRYLPLLAALALLVSSAGVRAQTPDQYGGGQRSLAHRRQHNSTAMSS